MDNGNLLIFSDDFDPILVNFFGNVIHDEFSPFISFYSDPIDIIDRKTHITYLFNNNGMYELFTDSITIDINNLDQNRYIIRITYMDYFIFNNYLDIPVEIRNILEDLKR